MTTTRHKPVIAVQLDTATFPSTSTVDVDDWIVFDVTLDVDNDTGGVATVQVGALPPDADAAIRLYLYADGELIFNGEISPIALSSDGPHTLTCQDALARLSRTYGGDDRTYSYDAGNPSDPANDTDTTTAQNVVEAGGVDASLTSIQGADQPIGTSKDVVVRGGTVVPGERTEANKLIDLLRLMDKSVVPNYRTFTRGDGVVTRRPREIGSSVATFSEASGGNAWGFRRTIGGTETIINKVLVQGLSIGGSPTQAEASAANSYLVAPWDTQVATIESYLIDDGTWAQDLADWAVAAWNGRLNTVTWTTALNNDKTLLGATVTVTSSRCDLSSQLVYVTRIQHHGDGETATTTFTAEFRS